jgi:CMP-N-acetylneuraminic acid synthetase
VLNFRRKEDYMITAFVPCRAGSERVPSKNTRDFAGIIGGLLRLKIDQLLSCSLIDQIIVSTNDEIVMNVISDYFGGEERVKVVPRPHELCTSATSTDDVVRYVPQIISEGIVLWTHVTSPFVTHLHYKEMIEQYLTDLQEESHDSLMSVSELRTFVWNDMGPINYERSVEKWPRTQTIKPLFEVNSAAFITDAKLIGLLNDRIGRRPRLFVLDKKVAFDVDWPDDFELAERMLLEQARKIENC